MSTSYRNDENYSIHVMALPKGFPDDKMLLSPRVSIVWKVTRSYIPEYLSFQKPIEDYTSSHPFNDVFGSIVWTNAGYMSLQSRENISTMISSISFPFELNRLMWKDFGHNNTRKPLNNVDDMIAEILKVINDMVVSGRKKVDLIVKIDMRYTLPDEEYQAKREAQDQETKARELTDNLMFLVSMVQRELARAEDPHETDRIWRNYHIHRRGIEDELRANNISVERTMENVGFLELEAAIIRESFDQEGFKSRPASTSAIMALESLALHCAGSMCVICQEDMLPGSNGTRMPCDHMFHTDCITEWLNQSNTCPYCKYELPIEGRKKRKVKENQ